MKTYYKVFVNEKNSNGCKYTLKYSSGIYANFIKYDEMTPELEQIIKTHKAPGYWSYNPHDWGECDVNVKVIKYTEEELCS